MFVLQLLGFDPAIDDLKTLARQNRTALLMDSSDLGSGADELRAGLDLPPARTVADVLALTAPRPLAL